MHTVEGYVIYRINYDEFGLVSNFFYGHIFFRSVFRCMCPGRIVVGRRNHPPKPKTENRHRSPVSIPPSATFFIFVCRSLLKVQQCSIMVHYNIFATMCNYIIVIIVTRAFNYDEQFARR